MYGVFSPDCSRLLTGGDELIPKVQIWDIETGKCPQTLTRHKEPFAWLGPKNNGGAPRERSIVRQGTIQGTRLFPNSA
jgi:hypothetical protein